MTLGRRIARRPGSNGVSRHAFPPATRERLSAMRERRSLSRIIAGRGGRGSACRRAAPGRPPTGSARRSSPPSRPGRARSAAAPQEALAGLGVLRPVRRLGSRRSGGGQPRCGPGPAGRARPADRPAHPRATRQDLDLDVTIQVGDVPSLLRRPAPAGSTSCSPTRRTTQATELGRRPAERHDRARLGGPARAGHPRAVPALRSRRTGQTWSPRPGSALTVRQTVYFGSLEGKGKV